MLLDFSNFRVNIHDRIKCKEEKCEYQNMLRNFLIRNNVSKKIIFFFLIVNIYSDVFSLLENVILNKEYSFQCINLSKKSNNGNCCSNKKGV